MTNKERTEAQRHAEAFNEAVWTHERMREAQRLVAKAAYDLHSRGWGLLALDNAEQGLRDALTHVQFLKTLEVE